MNKYIKSLDEIKEKLKKKYDINNIENILVKYGYINEQNILFIDSILVSWIDNQKNVNPITMVNNFIINELIESGFIENQENTSFIHHIFNDQKNIAKINIPRLELTVKYE